MHRSGFGRIQGALVEHPGFEPRPQLSSQIGTRIDFGQKRVLIDSVEAFFDVSVQDILALFGDGVENRLNRIVTGATRSEAITSRWREIK